MAIGDVNTNKTVSASLITTTIDNIVTTTETVSQTKSFVPIVYDNTVPISNNKQLATKEYVDGILNDFIESTGVSKEYLEVVSNTSLNVNGRITGWNTIVASPT
jgi:hypothetical protein